MPMHTGSSRSGAPGSGHWQGQGRAGELLLRALEDLSQLDFKRFRDALAHAELRGCSPIPWGRLEKADWIDTKNLMLEFYGAEAALDVAITVLEHIQLRNAAALLRESRERGGNAEQLPAPFQGLCMQEPCRGQEAATDGGPCGRAWGSGGVSGAGAQGCFPLTPLFPQPWGPLLCWDHRHQVGASGGKRGGSSAPAAPCSAAARGGVTFQITAVGTRGLCARPTAA